MDMDLDMDMELDMEKDMDMNDKTIKNKRDFIDDDLKTNVGKNRLESEKQYYEYWEMMIKSLENR